MECQLLLFFLYSHCILLLLTSYFTHLTCEKNVLKSDESISGHIHIQWKESLNMCVILYGFGFFFFLSLPYT